MTAAQSTAIVAVTIFAPFFQKWCQGLLSSSTSSQLLYWCKAHPHATFILLVPKETWQYYSGMWCEACISCYTFTSYCEVISFPSSSCCKGFELGDPDFNMMKESQISSIRWEFILSVLQCAFPIVVHKCTFVPFLHSNNCTFLTQWGLSLGRYTAVCGTVHTEQTSGFRSQLLLELGISS